MGTLVSTLVFRPPSVLTPLPRNGVIWLKTRNGNKIPSIHIQYPDSSFTILYSHANSEDIGQNYRYLKALSVSLGCSIFAYEYSGYGLCKYHSTPSEDNCYADIDAAYEYLITIVDPKKIILYGRSLGSGPSFYLAEKVALNRGVAGMILHSPFLSVCRIVLEMGWSLDMDMFHNIDRVKNIRCPTFIMHGTNDTIVPISHGISLHEQLIDNYRYPPFWAENMGHNNIECDMWETYVEKIVQFILYIRKRQLISNIIGSNKENIPKKMTTTLNIYDRDEVEMFYVVTPSPSQENKRVSFWNEDKVHTVTSYQQKMQLCLCEGHVEDDEK